MWDAHIRAVRCRTGQRLAARHDGNDVLASVHDQQRGRDARGRGSEIHSAGELAGGVGPSGAPGHDVLRPSPEGAVPPSRGGRDRASFAPPRNCTSARAAGTLAISQQALSKRIARLETLLGIALFQRAGGGVHLNEAGRRFLQPARQTVAATDAAVAAAAGQDRPLRVDVWGHLYASIRTRPRSPDGPGS
nr:LysR family transcriptional regulator [Streptomyces rectiverticillatus]